MVLTSGCLTNSHIWLETVLVGFLCLQLFPDSVDADKDVFFNKYGHCSQGTPFDLDAERITLKSMGGNDAYETLTCSVTLHSSSDDGLCLYFKSLDIKSCDVTLKIYASKSASGRTLRTVSCGDTNPGPTCTDAKYFSVLLVKRQLNKNTGYNFEIGFTNGGGEFLSGDSHSTENGESETQESGYENLGRSREKGGGSFNLVVIVVCVLGVIVVVPAITAVALYHCRRQRGVYTGETSSKDEEDPAMPS
ncbi:hypothetical protein ElyMa_006438200, partial [Elysia marginata]